MGKEDRIKWKGKHRPEVTYESFPCFTPFASRGTSKCKGPETCPKKSKKASTIRMNQEKETVVGRT